VLFEESGRWANVGAVEVGRPGGRLVRVDRAGGGSHRMIQIEGEMIGDRQKGESGMGSDGGYKIDARVSEEGCQGVGYPMDMNRLRG